MRSITTVIVVGSFTLAHAKTPVANSIAEVDKVVNTLIDDIFDLALRLRVLRLADLDGTILEKAQPGSQEAEEQSKATFNRTNEEAWERIETTFGNLTLDSTTEDLVDQEKDIQPLPKARNPGFLEAGEEAAGSQNKTGMLFETDFWAKEAEATLLRRNAGYLKVGETLPATMANRVTAWPAMCGADVYPDPPLKSQATNDEAERIFLRDAERTFRDSGHQKRMRAMLARVWPVTKDYHQGLGCIMGMLLLLFDDETTFRILLRIARNEKYTPGYWYGAPEAYVRDAMVYGRLLEEREPEVASLFSQAYIVPEAYVSKWFISLCVHVLPFRALFEFIEAFLEGGHVFLFQFALTLIGRVRDRLLSFQTTDINLILEVLRLDKRHYPDDYGNGDWFVSLVVDAKKVNLDPAQLVRLRAEESEKLAEKQRLVRDREAQMGAEDDDDITFSDEEKGE